MRILTLATAALVVAMAVTTSADAESVLTAFGGDGKGKSGKGGGCCQPNWYSGSLVGNVDFTFLRLHQAGGVRSSDGSAAEYDFEFAPRFSLAYETCDGLGIRGNHWFWDHSQTTNDGTDTISYDASTTDLEVYQKVDLTACTGVEVFGGVRYVNWTQRDSLGLDAGAHGYGGTMGLRGTRDLGRGLSTYAQARLSVIGGDAAVASTGGLTTAVGRALDHEMTMTEVRLGTEWRRCMGCYTVVAGAFGEWQQWSDAALAAEVGDIDTDANLYDIGFLGFGFNLGVEY